MVLFVSLSFGMLDDGNLTARGILFSTDFNDFFYYDCTFAKMMRFSTIHT